MLYCTFLKGSIEKCRNTEYDKSDLYGDDCSQYEKYDIQCGTYDNEDFDSNKICCLCGGGKTGKQNLYLSSF